MATEPNPPLAAEPNCSEATESRARAGGAGGGNPFGSGKAGVKSNRMSAWVSGGPPQLGGRQRLVPPAWVLRRTDQAVVAVGLLLAALAMLLWAIRQAGPEGHLVDIDQASPLKVDFRVDINQASWPELAQLPGVGPSLARRIVEHRATHGPFRSLDQLQKVRGIGPKKLEQIKPYLLPLPEDSATQLTPVP
ncbi:MAG: helix-hairpin-helix domain-containing protein [Thermoguttaceae bacterium]|nr:helix-hairpin-helix domain-containing protein [Thermoguttaceae bacterium]MDW8037234.1 helix-hairpin-helix domain-containing protein [Thermoguttaceae bacterium]